MRTYDVSATKDAFDGCVYSFPGSCKYLKCVEIQLSAEDYFAGTKRPADMKRYKNETEKLKVCTDNKYILARLYNSSKNGTFAVPQISRYITTLFFYWDFYGP